MVYFLSLDVFVCNAKKSETSSSIHDTLWVMINTNTLSYVWHYVGDDKHKHAKLYMTLCG